MFIDNLAQSGGKKRSRIKHLAQFFLSAVQVIFEGRSLFLFPFGGRDLFLDVGVVEPSICGTAVAKLAQIPASTQPANYLGGVTGWDLASKRPLIRSPRVTEASCLIQRTHGQSKALIHGEYEM